MKDSESSGQDPALGSRRVRDRAPQLDLDWQLAPSRSLTSFDTSAMSALPASCGRDAHQFAHVGRAFGAGLRHGGSDGGSDSPAAHLFRAGRPRDQSISAFSMSARSWRLAASYW